MYIINIFWITKLELRERLLTTDNYQLTTRQRGFQPAAANSFVFPEKCLNCFVMPDVQTHYLVTPVLSTTKGVGVVLSMSKHFRKFGK